MKCCCLVGKIYGWNGVGTTAIEAVDTPDAIYLGLAIGSVGSVNYLYAANFHAGTVDVFNGTCGAESGWVPVAAISPSVLVSEIEIEKRQHEQDKPPLLPSPVLDVSEDEG